MSLFKSDDRAKIEVKEIQLNALEKRLKEIVPFHEHLTLEIGKLKEDIQKLNEDLERPDRI